MNWRCRLRIHYYGLYERQHGYYEPPEMEYYCGECDQDGFPFRMRLWMLFWENRFFGETVVDWANRWHDWRHPSDFVDNVWTCLRHNKVHP